MAETEAQDPSDLIDEQPTFDDVLQRMEAAKVALERGESLDVLALVQDALQKIDSTLDRFTTVSGAIAVSASRDFFSVLEHMGMKAEEGDEALGGLEESLKEGDVGSIAERLQKLGQIVQDLRNEQIKKIGSKVEGVDRLRKSYLDFGVDVKEAQRVLMQARERLGSKAYSECLMFLVNTVKELDARKAERLAVLEDAINYVETLIREAKEIGVKIGEPRKVLSQAKKSFKGKKYSDAINAAIAAEKSVNDLVGSQIRRVMKLQRVLEEREKSVKRL